MEKGHGKGVKYHIDTLKEKGVKYHIDTFNAG